MSFSHLLKDRPTSAPPEGDHTLLRLSMIALCIGLAVFGYWLYMLEASYAEALISSDRALIVSRDYLVGAIFTPIASLAVALILTIDAFYINLLKRPLPRTTKRVKSTLAGVMLIGIALMIAGGLFVNSDWDTALEASGYTECDNFVLRFNKNFLNSAWVKDPQFCLDDELHQILHNNHSRTGFEQAARYLERTYP